jgi:hypothetical protein
MEHLRACEEVVEVHEDANTHIHESHEGRMAPTAKPTQFESLKRRIFVKHFNNTGTSRDLDIYFNRQR